MRWLRVIWAAGAFLALAAAAAGYVVLRAQQPAANAPDRIRRDPGRRLVVCAGASVTLGRMSVNYVALLEERLGARFQFANAGRNGDLAWNLLQRLDPIVALHPDVVVLQIGSNDVNASLTPEAAARYRRLKGLPTTPSRESYRESLTAVVKRLNQETKARVAILSLPLIGEDLDSDSNQRVRSYDEVISEVALAERAAYLPLNEAMAAAVRAEPPYRSAPFANRQIAESLLQRYLLGRSFDRIGARYGYRLLSDGLHLNSRGAGIVADVVARHLVDTSP
jgi:lysophospholipase L1-like esterase